jgi:hypothetical protein
MHIMATNETAAGTTVSAQLLGNGDILLKYSGMPGNHPGAFGNMAFLWQFGLKGIPYGTAPLQAQPIQNNTQAGEILFKTLPVQKQPYIIGYAVGLAVATVCSSVSIAADGTTSAFQTSVNVLNGTSQMVSVAYNTPPGNQPERSGQWIGLWQGPAPSYTTPPVASVQINSNNSAGSIALQATILAGATYSLGYFMAKGQTTLAASCTFTA